MSNKMILVVTTEFLVWKASNKNYGNTTMTTTKSQSNQPAPFTKGGLSFGITDLATIKYHWVHDQ
jgi:hypothetical protein